MSTSTKRFPTDQPQGPSRPLPNSAQYLREAREAYERLTHTPDKGLVRYLQANDRAARDTATAQTIGRIMNRPYADPVTDHFITTWIRSGPTPGPWLFECTASEGAQACFYRWRRA